MSRRARRQLTEATMSRFTRRDFLATAAVSTIGASTLAAMPRPRGRPDPIRVGVIGCGGRGTGAANDAVTGSEGIEIVAMGDLFPDRVESSRAELTKALGEKFKVEPARMFSGFDAYQRVIESPVDLVILATPPAFRPTHLRAAVEAGKHVFMEKPVAVDPAGVRSVMASAELATKKGLAIVAGTQRRHDPRYVDAVRRIRDGAIGDVVAGQVYWNQGGLWSVEQKAGMSDTEWQVRNWLYFTALSGDHIVEQHIHNLDVANWVLGGHPVRANGVGGRQVRTEPVYGHIFDHFGIELEYANGARVLSMCRQQDGTARFVGEQFQGTRGATDARSYIRGTAEWKYEGPVVNPYVQEHTDLVASIRAGQPLNEGQQVAESTLTAIMAREAAYTGQVITWEQILASDLDLGPAPLGFDTRVVPPVPQPGVTQLSRPATGHTRAAQG